MLTARTETILERKKELEREGIEAINKKIDYLASKPGFYKIMNDRTPQKTVMEILKIVFEQQHRKNKGRLLQSLTCQNYTAHCVYTKRNSKLQITTVCHKIKGNRIHSYIARNSIIFYFLSGVFPAFIGMVAQRCFSECIYPIAILVAFFSLVLAWFVTIVINKHFPFLIDMRKLWKKRKQ